MSSSLASQLSKLPNHSSRLSSKSLISSSSYLFPSRLASTQDLETIHSLAQNGWSSLSLTSIIYSESESGSRLFGERSKEEDRMMMSKEENQELDHQIQDWLELVGENLLGKDSAKCLEWLVRRYRAHEFNVEILLSAFLPFHETPQFSRMLQICKLDSLAQFSFLLPLQKSSLPLTSSHLLSSLSSTSTSSSSLDLLNLIIKLPIKSQPFETQITFWCSILIRFLALFSGNEGVSSEDTITPISSKKPKGNKTTEERRNQAQVLASILLPNVLILSRKAQASLKGSSSTGIGERKMSTKLAQETLTACNLVLSSCSRAFPLSLETVKSIVDGSFKTSGASEEEGKNKKNNLGQLINKETKNSILFLLFGLCGNLDPNSLDSSPLALTSNNSISRNQIFSACTIESLLKLLGGRKALVSSIREFRGQFDLSSFLKFLIGGCVESLSTGGNDSKQAQKLLEELMSIEGLDHEILKELVRVLIRFVPSSDSSSNDTQEVHLFRIEILARFRQRKPQVWEETISSLVETQIEEKSQIWSLVKEVMAFGIGSPTSDSISQKNKKSNGEDLKDSYLGIYSSSALQRQLSLKNLFDSIRSGEITKNDSFVKEAIKARIGDSDIKVLEILYSAENSDLMLEVLTSEGDKAKKLMELLYSIVGALSPKFELSRAGIKCHLKFLLGTFLKKCKDLNGSGEKKIKIHSIESIILRKVLWNRLIWNKSGRKTSEMIAEVLKESKQLSGELELLSGVWEEFPQANESEDEDSGSFKRNRLIVERFTEGLLQVQKKDSPAFKVLLDFILGQVGIDTEDQGKKSRSLKSGPEENHPSGRILGLLVFKDLISKLDIGGQVADESNGTFETFLTLALKLTNHLTLSSENLSNFVANKELDLEKEIKETSNSDNGFISINAHKLIYSKTSSSKCSNLLGSLLLISILSKFNSGKISQNKDICFLQTNDQINSNSNLFSLFRNIYSLTNNFKLNPTLAKTLLAMTFSSLGNSVLGFLTRIFTSSADEGSSTLLRLASISHCSAFLKAFLPSKEGETETPSIDFQTIVPALLIALSDEKDQVRWKAIECLQIVKEINERCKKQNGKVEVWEYDRIYGERESADLQYLDLEATGKFVDMILASKENFKYDSEYLPMMCQSSLNVKKEDGKKVATLRHSMVCYLLSHVSCWSFMSSKLPLLRALSLVSDSSKLSILLPKIRSISSTSNLKDSTANFERRALSRLSDSKKEGYVSLLLASFDSTARLTLEDGSSGAWSTFLACLSESDATIQKHAVLALQSGLFSSLNFEMKRDVFLHLVNVLTDGSRSNSTELRQCVKSLNADSMVLVHVLAQLRSVFPDAVLLSTQAKDSNSENSQSQASAALASVVEGILARSIQPTASLINELFFILEVGIDQHANLHVNAEYLMQLSMRCLTKLLDKASPKDAEVGGALRIDVAVKLIRDQVSKNPQTFQEAMLLLATMAAIKPDQVMADIMVIISHISKEGLSRDDSYNFSVMEKTLRSILPVLVSSLKNKTGGSSDHFSLLLESRNAISKFTNNVKFMPKHRRQPFFDLLVEVLGEQDFLSAVCMLLIDIDAFKISKQKEQRDEGRVMSTLHLPLSIMRGHSAAVQLVALGQIWQEIQRLWQNREADVTEADSKVFLSRLNVSPVDEHSANQPDPRKQISALLAFIKRAIKDVTFERRLDSEGWRSSSKDIVGRGLESFIQNALEMSSVDDSVVSEDAGQTLTNITALAPVSTLMRVVVNLVKSKDAQRQESGYDLFSSRLSELDSEERETVASNTQAIVQAALATLEDGKKQQSHRLSALQVLRQIASSLLESEHAAISAVLPVTMSLVQDAKVNLSIRQSAFILISQLSVQLGPRLIPQIAALSPLCLSTVQLSLDASSGIQDSTLRQSALETLSGLFISVPVFMTSQLEPILTVAVIPELQTQSKLQSRSNGKKVGEKQVQNPLSCLLTTLIKNSEVQDVFDSLFAAWEKAEKSSKVTLIGLLDFLQKALRQTSREGMAKVYKSVYRFILKVLDLRRLSSNLLTNAEIHEIENSCLKGFLKMVLKLNETTFRPLFLRIFDWAVLDLVEEEGLESDSEKVFSDHGICARRLVLYKVINLLLEGLRGLVSSYYATLLDLSIELLTGFAEGKVKGQTDLWIELVKSLEKSSTYDEGTFWNPVRLSKLIPSLVNQVNLVPNSSSSKNAISESVLTSSISKTISSLAETVSEESSLKLINSSLLTKTRNSNIRIRISALNCLTTLWNNLAEAMLGLVPETTPFLAELLDSEDSETLESTRMLVGEIEKVLGEPLDEYLQ